MKFEAIAATDRDFVRLLAAADLPVDDLGGDHQSFWAGRDGAGEVVTAGGLERCGDDVLLRSMVVRDDMRGHGLGGALLAFLVAQAFAQRAGAIFLLSDGAEDFFSAHGFRRVQRSSVPQEVAASAQFSEICPASATAMSLVRA